jgi:sortase A
VTVAEGNGRHAAPEESEDAGADIATGDSGPVTPAADDADGGAPARTRRADRPRGAGDIARFIARGAGQTLITVGLVLLLFVAYEVWVTNIFAHAERVKVQKQIERDWDEGKDPLKGQDRLNLPEGKQVVIPVGVGFANLYIPRFGKDYAFPIVEGVQADTDLERGVGHYPGTAIPGQIGNFAVAGHRVGKGEPFLNLDHLRPGDAVVVQTAQRWYIYRVLGDTSDGDLAVKDKQGVPGREIVSPDATQVIAAVPDSPGLTPTRALMTMTTCHPKYTANQRMIIHAELDRAVAVSGKALPKELGGTL